MTILVALHAMAAVVWVGGMFFAYIVLRPAAGPLETPARLSLWQRVFSRFFPWVWASIAVLLFSGYAILFLRFGGFAGAGLHIHVMQLTGILMMLLFFHLFFAPWRRFSRSVEAGALQDAGAALSQIRRIVAINLVLGLLTVAVGASGRFWA
ncbi:MAG: CopD family protein [Methyloceanibacter sp.]